MLFFVFKYFKSIQLHLNIIFTHCLRHKIIQLSFISAHALISHSHRLCVSYILLLPFRYLLIFVPYSFSFPAHCSSPVWRMYFVVAVQHHRLINGSVAHIFCCYFRCLCNCSSACKSCTFHIHHIQNNFARQISVEFFVSECI